MSSVIVIEIVRDLYSEKEVMRGREVGVRSRLETMCFLYGTYCTVYGVVSGTLDMVHCYSSVVVTDL